jgi:dynein heavy chain
MLRHRTFNPKAAGGNVERWLIECEASMRETLKETLKRSFEAAARDPRLQWVGQWPGQVVLAVDCMYWTHNTAKAIVKGTLEPYTTQLTDELLQVCDGCAHGRDRLVQCP